MPVAAEPADSGRQQVRIRRHRGKQGGGWGGDGDGWASGMNLADREREAQAVQVFEGLSSGVVGLAVGFEDPVV